MRSEEPASYAIRLHERAVRDINAAFVRFGELVSWDVADEWREGLRDSIASLALNPRRCPSAPEDFTRDVRQLVYRRIGSRTAYRILFVIAGEDADSPDAPTITVLHIRHAAMRPISPKKAREIEKEA